MEFIGLSKETLIEGKTRCPCKKCKLRKWFVPDDVGEHILFNGFYKDYRKWTFHCKDDSQNNMQADFRDQLGVVGEDDMLGLLKEAFGFNIPQSSRQPQDHSSEPRCDIEGLDEIYGEMNFYDEEGEEVPIFHTKEDEARYRKLVEASNEGLYEGCTTFSKLSFLLHLFHLKCTYNWCNESFTKLLELEIGAFPQIKEFPSSYYEGKKVITDLGLGYKKIDACPNDCMLYLGEFTNQDMCHVCHTSRWKTMRSKGDYTTDLGAETCKIGEPAKVVRYFPLIPRLKRIYMSSKTAKDMRWHHKDFGERKDDGILRHPADGEAWKTFDKRYPDFAADPRNIRLGLATDGFNPYRLMSTTYSTWPIVLIPYNLPPWICMKPSSFILSTIIPGKLSPGIDIDVYMQPLIHELKLLWDGVDVFDSYTKKNFKLRVALHSTINDFPAYAMLSGWSTKGYKACPVCTHSTDSYRFGGKICYLGHRKWLPSSHPYRSQATLFDGKVEYGDAPIRASRSDILREQERSEYVYGKKKKPSKKKEKKKRKQAVVISTNEGVHGEIDGDGDVGDGDGVNVLCSKRSILFDLEYWEHNSLRHSLDVMHIEKNVCDNLLGTLLEMDKNRDDEKARSALKEMGIKPHLWLRQNLKGKIEMPLASFSMTEDDKQRFLKVLQKLKVPDGYGSNLHRCVNLKQQRGQRLMNLKSHDNHVIMQDILPVALRASNATQVIDLLEHLSFFFKKLCSTTLHKKDLNDIHSNVVVTLCKLEMEFLPTFFTIMVYLLIHLVDEVKLGGPVHYRWMYPVERYLAYLKSQVSNKAQPEGSIAEGYLLRETILFCSRYLEGIETVFNKPKRNDEGNPMLNCYMFGSGGRVIGKVHNFRLDDKSLRQAHRYVLIHSNEMKSVIEHFMALKQQQIDSGSNQSNQNDWIINEFAAWLQNQVHILDDSSVEGKMRKTLALGLSNRVKKIKGFLINGYKFDIIERERYRKTQNSGVMVEADGQEYYGKLKAIYELDYYGSCKVVMFHCDWVDIYRGLKKNSNGSVCVNFSKLMHTGRNLGDDPFVFSSQARQVFYVEDELKKGWLHVVKTKPRDLFELGNDMP